MFDIPHTFLLDDTPETPRRPRPSRQPWRRVTTRVLLDAYSRTVSEVVERVGPASCGSTSAAATANTAARAPASSSRPTG